MPKNNQFFSLNEWEEILITLKRHWITFAFLSCYLVGFLVLSWIFLSFSRFGISLVWEKIFWFFFSIFALIFIAILMMMWINSELDFLIVTDKRIIYFEQTTFLSRKIIEFPLSSIQEIRSKVSGILPTIFQYGEISIATANSQEIMRLPYIWNPGEKIREINNFLTNLQKN